MNLGSVRDYDELVRRLVVTAIIYFAYRLGARLPLPGISPDALSQLHGSAPEHISILALGITPYVTALIFVELIKTLFPPLRRWEVADARHRAKLARFVVGIALLAAAAQASGLVLAMEDIQGLVTSPGTPFRLATIATLVAGTALVIWLADKITRHGLGSGIWILFTAPWITAASYKLATWFGLRGSETVIVIGLIVALAFTFIVLAAIVCFLRAGGAPKPLRETSLWSVLLGNSAWPWLLIALALIAGGAADLQSWLAPTGLLSLLLLAGLIALMTRLYLRSWRVSEAPVALPLSPALLATALAVITFADMMVGASLPGLVPLAGHSVITAVIMLEILQRWWVPPFPERSDATTPGT